MPAQRCDPCNELWPPGVNRRCPRCNGFTYLRRNEAPTRTMADVASAINRRAFKEYYDKREKDRELRGDVSPDVLGRLEARRDIAALHADG